MANILLFLALLIFPLFFISQTVIIRVEYVDEPIISIDFIFFCLWIFPERKKNKRRKIKKRLKRFKYLPKLRRAFLYFLKGSQIRISEPGFSDSSDSPSLSALKFQGIRSFYSLLLAYLSSRADAVSVDSSILNEESENNSYIKGKTILTLYSSIKNILFSFFILIFS